MCIRDSSQAVRNNVLRDCASDRALRSLQSQVEETYSEAAWVLDELGMDRHAARIRTQGPKPPLPLVVGKIGELCTEQGDEIRGLHAK
eukprot:1984184-Karenia_brevis.AAC.1